MMAAGSRHAVPATLMRGGTSRGPVLRATSLPTDTLARDDAVVKLVGGDARQTDGLGGGGPTTSKVVVVRPLENDPEGAHLDYAVGNIVVGRHAVDWSGTCGNMTAAVPLYGVEEGLTPCPPDGRLRLRNLSTGQLIDTVLRCDHDHERGREAVVTTSYLEPTGAVLGSLLPTKSGLDVLHTDGRRFQASLVDVTHPYLFLLYEEVVGGADLRDETVLALIEHLRGLMCVRLGLAASPADAMATSAAVPRVVLLHRDQSEEELKITAISMGQPIESVPVTAGMCLAAARHLPSTLVAQTCAVPSSEHRLVVAGPSARLSAVATMDERGGVRSVAVDRTARTIMCGTTWL